jgi:hypothetical protein
VAEMVVFEFLLVLAPIIFLTLFSIWLYFYLFWKAKVIILSKYDKTYFFLKEKKLMSLTETIKIGDDTYVLSKPTYFVSGKRVFYFEKGNSQPLNFLDTNTIDAKKLNLLLNAKVVEQLVKGVRAPSIDFKTIMYLVIIAIVIIAFFLFFPNIMGPLTPATTTTTTATPISPIRP